jgi:DNA processing protein
MSDTKYCVGFTLIPGIGRARFSKLEQHFGGLEQAWHASAKELEMAGLDQRSVEAIVAMRPKISLDAEMEKLDRYKVTVLTLENKAYPSRLKEIYDPPPVLYVRGRFTLEDDWSLAVVGTRRPTYYGREVTEQIVGDLARNRITIVSGLAKGIDATAHRAALDAGGWSIAVFGCGLDIVYPRDHVKLARDSPEKPDHERAKPWGCGNRGRGDQRCPYHGRSRTGAKSGGLCRSRECTIHREPGNQSIDPGRGEAGTGG